jgi:hypothetical protein
MVINAMETFFTVPVTARVMALCVYVPFQVVNKEI